MEKKGGLILYYCHVNANPSVVFLWFHKLIHYMGSSAKVSVKVRF